MSILEKRRAALATRVRVVPLPKRELELKFEEYHKNNPEVYERLVELALGLLNRGHKRYGIAGLFEVLRWESAMETVGDHFKLNNNYRAFYARLIMDNEPRLHGFFETRRQTAKRTMETP